MHPLFYDPSDIPRPPDEVRIRDLRASLHPDGRRVAVFLELTPFIQPPNAELRLSNSQDEELASASIIEAFNPKMELILHMRGQRLDPPFQLIATIYYWLENETVDNQSFARSRRVVDERQVSFGDLQSPESQVYG